MYITYLKLKNWKNFKNIEVNLKDRMFLIGPNASGKSNFLDVFCFLKDIAKSPAGGLHYAVSLRGSISKIRCLAARQDTDIEIEVHLGDEKNKSAWEYKLGFNREPRGYRRILIKKEVVHHLGNEIINRPDKLDIDDDARLTQTALEQINANQGFREIADYFSTITYLHLVPQLLKHPERFRIERADTDPFGQGILNRIADTGEKTRKSRLNKIQKAMQAVVPQLENLEFTQDNKGQPHIKARFSHWRPKGAWQLEDQLSDGTLRLIGLLWALVEGDSLLLLEEPELSLNDRIIKIIPNLITKIQRLKKDKRQVLMSTHSEALLSDKSIDGCEVIRFEASEEGTTVDKLTETEEKLLRSGFSPAEVLLPQSGKKLKPYEILLPFND